MGSDLSFRIVYGDSDAGDWEDVPSANRKNEVLGYVGKKYTKDELRTLITNMVHEISSYDYNMRDIANAIASLEYIMERMYSSTCVAHIKYQ